MRAVVTDPDRPSGLRLAEVPEPEPGPGEAIVEVRAVSVNPGEIASRVGAAAGTVIGWEAAGVVVRTAADGTGPAAGDHVATFGDGGGWAERRAVPTGLLGSVPTSLDLADASTLPIAAGSALRALRLLGGVVGTRVLVVGATGAVGRFAVQLGARAGADVVAVARDTARHEQLRGLGALEVHADPAAVAPVHHALDTVGGPHLVAAFGLLRSGGVLVSVGRSSGADAVLSADALVGDVGRSGLRLRTYFLAEDLTGMDDDLRWLGAEVAAGRLRTDVAERVPFADLPDRLREPLRGKLVATL